VCHSLGLETGSASADYIQLWRGNAQLLTASLEIVQLTSAQILDALGLVQMQTDNEAANQASILDPRWC
jgi:hypothetical protein